MRSCFSALLLLACCAVGCRAQATANGTSAKKTIWDEPIKFNTKAKDACAMVVSGVAELTRLRVSCKSPTRSYWCDYQGRPDMCRAYNTNPRHFFTQIMWDMRKLANACQGPRVYRPQMCKRGPDDAQMMFVGSWPKMPAAPKPTKAAPERQPQQQGSQSKPLPVSKTATPKPAKPQPAVAKPGSKVSSMKKTMPKPAKTTKVTTVTAKPTEQVEGDVTKLAQDYCWKSFEGICSYFISWFHNN